MRYSFVLLSLQYPPIFDGVEKLPFAYNYFSRLGVCFDVCIPFHGTFIYLPEGQRSGQDLCPD